MNEQDASDDGSGPDPVLSERRQLINVAYRMLGSLAEAEDVVQEAYTRWYAMSPVQQDGIESPGAWLTTVTSRLCLNLLRSARARREQYVGEWIPEPLPGRVAAPSVGAVDPADQVTLDESVGMAFLVVLDSMTPAERVSFILHDVFRYPFIEVSAIVGRTPAACRQLASSARRRLIAPRASATPNTLRAEVVHRFREVWEAKDIDALIALLDPDATAIADGGGRAVTFLRPIEGGLQVARAWMVLADKLSNSVLLERTVNGQAGLVAERDGVIETVFAFDVVDDHVKHIWVIRNPEKLRAWSAA
jgi:RNA polymerase sigma factor (sigma-70 family)